MKHVIRKSRLFISQFNKDTWSNFWLRDPTQNFHRAEMRSENGLVHDSSFVNLCMKG